MRRQQNPSYYYRYTRLLNEVGKWKGDTHTRISHEDSKQANTNARHTTGKSTTTTRGCWLHHVATHEVTGVEVRAADAQNYIMSQPAVESPQGDLKEKKPRHNGGRGGGTRSSRHGRTQMHQPVQHRSSRSPCARSENTPKRLEGEKNHATGRS